LSDKFVAYIRLSKDGTKQKEGRSLGLDSQESIINYYYGDKIVMTFVEIKSAKNISERDELKKAIEYCIKNNCYLVVAKVDRLSRCVEDALYVWNKLNKRLKCCDIPGETDKFNLVMFTMFAERERELISICTKQALKTKIKNQGQYNFGNPWLVQSGLTERARKAKTEKANSNEFNIRAGNYICLLRKERLTLMQICERLNNEGFTTAKEKQFNPKQVSRLLNRYSSDK
jgi:DNA invertase Pin-like site-specific DNA recombinase